MQRSPFEGVVLGAFTLVGGLYTADMVVDLALRPPPTLEEHLPAWLVAAWHVTLLAGGTIGLVGFAWRDRVTGLLIERVSMWILMLGPPVYGVILLVTRWPTSLAAGTVWVSIGIAAATRIGQITRNIHRAQQSTEAVQGADGGAS